MQNNRPQNCKGSGCWVQRIVRCHGLFANFQQTLKNGFRSLSAALICCRRQIICSKRNNSNRQLRISWVCQVVFCLEFGALFSCVSEASAKIQTYRTLDKSALFLNINLHTEKPISKSAVFNFSDLRFESTDKTSKIRPALLISHLLIVGGFFGSELLVPLCLTPSGESVIDANAKQTARQSSKSEADKLWDADPYGLDHDVADAVHYFLMVAIIAIVTFIISWRMTPNSISVEVSRSNSA